MQAEQVAGNGRTRRLLVGAVLIGLVATSFAAPPASASGAPPRLAPDVVALTSGASVTVNPLANDSDPEGDPLTLMAVTLAPAGSGSARVAGSQVVLTAAATFVGQMVATYAVGDGTSTAYSTITATVAPPSNHHPVAQPDVVTMPSGGVATVDPRANDTDPDGDPLTVTGVATSATKAGTVNVEGGLVVIRAKPGYVGTMGITYAISDGRGGAAKSSVTATIVAAPNRAPVAKPDAASVKVRKTVKIPVLANDGDPDGDALRLVSVSRPSAGKAKVSGSKIRFTAPKSAGSATMTYRVADARGAVSAATVTVQIMPKAAKAPATRPSQPTTSKQAVEAALARLGMPVGTVNGTYDAKTRRAVCAWRTATGRHASRALPSAAEAQAILSAKGLPRASSTFTTGVTVSVTCQAAFWVGSDRTFKRVMAASTGKAGYRTRTGDFRVFRAFTTWRRSTIYREAMMYKPLQFSGGQALHGSATDQLVKTYPASHGCVRMLHRDIDAMHRGGVWIGSKVRVIGRW